MKQLEQGVSRGRAALRRVRAVAPGSARSLRPVRLVLRLDRSGLASGSPGTGAPLGLEAWQQVLAQAVEWLGPVRVCFAGGEPTRSELLLPLVRFANRVECPTHLVTCGPVSGELAVELVDRGLAGVTVCFAGLEDEVHRPRTGVPLSETLASVDHLRTARLSRSRPLALLAALELHEQSLGVLGPLAGLAREAGVDGVLVRLGLGQAVPPGTLEALGDVGPHLTSSALMATLGGRPPRWAAPRLEVLPDGAVSLSPELPPAGRLGDTEVQALWEAADDGIAAYRGLERAFDEVELVPETLYSSR